MRLKALLACGCVALAAGGCSKDTDGTITAQDPLAGVRYVNLVSDTGALDIRIIDIVGDAPNTVAATFRTGGAPNGVTNPIPTQPPHLPVRAGTRQIRVFLNGSTPSTASTIMLDTTVTFEANSNYTFFLTGFARTGSTPAMQAFVVKDSVPTIPAGRTALRVINLAPTLASSVNQPANLSSPLDVSVTASTGAVPVGGTPAFANLIYGAVSPYVMIDTTASATAVYRMTAAASGTTTPVLFAGVLPSGTRGSATANPLAGTYVVGSAITAVIVPRTVAGSTAPGGTAAITSIDSVIRSNDTVTVVRTLAAGTAAGVAANDVVTLSGLTQPEYNGAHIVISATAGTSSPALRARFRFRISGTPVSPATGAPAFRVAASGINRALDFTTPGIIYLIDQQPPRTAP